MSVRSIHPRFKTADELTDFVNISTDVFSGSGLMLVQDPTKYGVDYSVIYQHGDSDILIRIARIEHERSKRWDQKEWPRRGGIDIDYSVPLRKARYCLGSQKFISKCVCAAVENRGKKIDWPGKCRQEPEPIFGAHGRPLLDSDGNPIHKPKIFVSMNESENNCWFASMHDIFDTEGDWKLIYHDTGRERPIENVFVRKERTPETSRSMEGFENLRKKLCEESISVKNRVERALSERGRSGSK